MPRSVRKGPFVDPSLLKKVLEVESSGSNVIIKTKSRRSAIIPPMVGLVISVHNGKSFVAVLITKEMLDFKLGDFAPTRVIRSKVGDKKAKGDKR
ncbi:MAG TPA: 30S ribosomal protein S19 [Gammaproteobacteria bacterium]|nr:30S ribosomal protein S19 [Gammaproteobacteria bacterium]